MIEVAFMCWWCNFTALHFCHDIERRWAREACNVIFLRDDRQAFVINFKPARLAG